MFFNRHHCIKITPRQRGKKIMNAEEVVPQRRRRDLFVETIFPKEFLAP
jgi:hypothetical protein